MILLESIAVKMETAGINSLICIVTVFSVLIFMSFLISLFINIQRAENAIKYKRVAKAEAEQMAEDAINKTISQIREKEECEECDDLELIAVIAAAIAEFEGTTTDGFVVRSIKKLNKSSWRNA